MLSGVMESWVIYIKPALFMNFNSSFIHDPSISASTLSSDVWFGREFTGRWTQWWQMGGPPASIPQPLSVWPPSLCCSEAVHSAPSDVSGVMVVCACSSLLTGEGEAESRALPPPLPSGAPHWSQLLADSSDQTHISFQLCVCDHGIPQHRTSGAIVE